MGPSGHAPAFIFAVFDMVNGSMRVSRALICSRMLVTKIYTGICFTCQRKLRFLQRNLVEIKLRI